VHYSLPQYEKQLELIKQQKLGMKKVLIFARVLCITYDSSSRRSAHPRHRVRATLQFQLFVYYSPHTSALSHTSPLLRQDKKKAVLPSQKFKFSFDWEAGDDTSQAADPLNVKKAKPLLMFGRGFIAGEDRCVALGVV
jgi:hypothetical protein